MATVVLTVKLMPESPSVDLAKIKELAKSSMEAEGARNISFEEKPIAFGLKAVYIKLDMDEAKGSEIVEQKLSEIPEVSSVTIEDYRRAFG